MKLKPFKAWLLWDAEGTYVPTIHLTRRDATLERNENRYRDAKWRIGRVVVRSTSTRTNAK